jgi:hypothetical protein
MTRLTFFLGFVSQHRTKGDISDTFDALDGSVKLGINDDPALVIFLDSDCLEIQPISIGTTPDCHQNHICFELVR